jgi:hypothetical protein
METSAAGIEPVRQDLLFLCQRAESLADALMHTPKKNNTPPHSQTPFPTPQDAKGRSYAERELSDLMAQRHVS